MRYICCGRYKRCRRYRRYLRDITRHAGGENARPLHPLHTLCRAGGEKLLDRYSRYICAGDGATRLPGPHAAPLEALLANGTLAGRPRWRRRVGRGGGVVATCVLAACCRKLSATQQLGHVSGSCVGATRCSSQVLPGLVHVHTAGPRLGRALQPEMRASSTHLRSPESSLWPPRRGWGCASRAERACALFYGDATHVFCKLRGSPSVNRAPP